jgi:hypothetical protein
MRLKIVLPVLMLGCLVVAPLLWFRPGAAKAPSSSTALAPATAGSTPEASAAKALAAPQAASAKPGPGAQPGGAGFAPDSPEATSEAYVAARVAQLQDLAADDSPASLDIIVSELTNRDPEIRQAAREAAVQFGSREAIPKLLDAAGQTDDAQEKAALLEAAEFLKLPTPTELAGTAETGQGTPPPRNGGKPARPPR